jgi:hypothetical protein
MDQMSAVAFAVVRALRVRAVACGELHGSLLVQNEYHASGVYSVRSRLSLAYIHTRYRGTPPKILLDKVYIIHDTERS